MPSKYAKASLPASGAETYDSIVHDTPALRAALPYSTQPGVTSSMIGDMLYQDLDLANAFINTLINRIALTLVQSKYWSDPWVGLEKGKLGTGEIIQEVFINLSKPHDYDPATAEKEVFKRDIPDVATAFHQLNYKKFYKKTIQGDDLRGAFVSWDGLNRFISDIITSMFASANYDVNQVKRYMLAFAIVNGFAGVEVVQPLTTKTAAEDAVAAARATSLDMLELSTNFNRFGVPNFTPFEDQMIIINNRAAGKIDVSVLAADFNMDKAEFLTMHRLAISSFGSLDTARLAQLFANDPSYVPITAAQLAELDKIPFIIVDRNWFQIYDYTNLVNNIYNNDGLYWNYDYHVWKVFGSSPFSNIKVFSTITPSVTSVTVSPTAVTVSVGQTAQLSATVVTEGFASKEVTWSSSNTNVDVNGNGLVSVLAGATGTATITATSVADSTKTGTATVTIATA